MQTAEIFGDGDTIAAPATPAGGALCIVRMSGPRAIELCDAAFSGRRPLAGAGTATVHYGRICDGGEVIDDVLVTLFRAPHSYTGEDAVEISAHGSAYIVERILALLARLGARPAEAGEFTRRAFLNGRIDLSQAEAVADMIASDSRASHAVASTQMRGGYSDELRTLRDELLHITSLLELELDFSEEDVEFADRKRLSELLRQTHGKVCALAESFALGNAIKEGVAVAIAGRPNVGKSTLLNRLVGEDRAMVSDIAGTTRDTVEVKKNIGGVIYRFTDTAGLHATDDRLERMGIERTEKALRKARIILWLTDDERSVPEGDLNGFVPEEGQKIYRIITKTDLTDNCVPAGRESGRENGDMNKGTGTPARVPDFAYRTGVPGRCGNRAEGDGRYDVAGTIRISAKTGEGMDALLTALQSAVDASAAYNGNVIVSNRRHHNALLQAAEALDAAISSMNASLPADLLSEDIRQVMYHIGTITGEITSDDILHNIFSKFCIGK